MEEREKEDIRKTIRLFDKNSWVKVGKRRNTRSHDIPSQEILQYVYKGVIESKVEDSSGEVTRNLEPWAWQLKQKSVWVAIDKSSI